MSSLARPNPVPAPQPLSPLQQIGGVFLLLFLFLAYSRTSDFALPQLHLPLIAALLALLILGLTGGLPRVFRTGAAKWLSAFSLWAIAAIPFSTWRGGSFAMIKEQWLKSFLVFVLLTGLTYTLGQCRRAMYTVAYAILVVCFLALYFHARVLGRLMLPFGALGNPNDLAQVVLMGLPFWLLMIAVGGVVRKILAVAAILVLLVVLVATGSRGALVAVAAMCLMLFVRSSGSTKLKLVFAGVLGLGVVAISTPGNLARRYASLFGSDDAIVDISDEAAMSSMAERSTILKQSLLLTLRHPVFGVGPGNFSLASTDLFHAAGQRAGWRESHNAYTQISSETGLPGLIFYMGALLFCFRRLLALEKRTRNRPDSVEPHAMAYFLLLAWAGFFTSSAFSSIAYQMHFPFLIGLTAALLTTVEQFPQVAKPAPVQPAPGLGAPRRPFTRGGRTALV